MNGGLNAGAAVELPAVEAGLLPERYGSPMQDVLLQRLEPLLRPGIAILDVGSGRAPTLATDQRPADCHYTGLDISRLELDAAGRSAYTDTVVADITRPLPTADAAYDVIVSWQVLEHVKPLSAAFDNLRRALVPGGTLLAQLSGSRAAFAVFARVLPHRARVFAMSSLLGHPPEAKFPTHHDRSTATVLRELLGSWSAVDVVPFYRGATYFDFARPLQRAYLAYENRIERRGAENFATHYLVAARR